MQKIVAEHPDEQKYQEAPRARPEEAVVEAQSTGDRAGPSCLIAARVERRMCLTEVPAEHRVDEGEHQHDRQQVTKPFG